MSKKQLVLFDGVCQFCNGSVQFIINRDPNNQFLFAPIQSPLGQALMEHYQLVDEPDTFVLVREGRFLTRSDAVLSTCLLYTSPSPRDLSTSRMPSSA